MKKRKYKIGDTVTVIAYTPACYAREAMDELGTEQIFKDMVGRSYRVHGFDQYGHLELRPTRSDTIWIGQKDVKLRAESPKRKRRPND